MDGKLDLILSYLKNNVPATTISNNSSVSNNTSSTPDQNSLTENDGLKINSDPSTLSFRKWLVTKAMGVNKKICPIKAYIHHHQFNLTAGHNFDKVQDEKHHTEKAERTKNNNAYYKHTVAIRVMDLLLGNNVPKFPSGLYDKIPNWQKMIRTKLNPVLLELRSKYDSTNSEKRVTEILPTIGQLVSWSTKIQEEKNNTIV